mmetsp:Transcript_9283/g.22532  ORF Transcript_9283/g.22532 Transcript_9283/m.22532 type:complete len:213 (-) Transcript_9283:409-1047(-)
MISQNRRSTTRSPRSRNNNRNAESSSIGPVCCRQIPDCCPLAARCGPARPMEAPGECSADPWKARRYLPRPPSISDGPSAPLGSRCTPLECCQGLPGYRVARTRTRTKRAVAVAPAAFRARRGTEPGRVPGSFSERHHHRYTPPAGRPVRASSAVLVPEHSRWNPTEPCRFRETPTHFRRRMLLVPRLAFWFGCDCCRQSMNSVLENPWYRQ